MSEGRCREVGPDPFYPAANSGTGVYTDAVLVCEQCPVRKECLAFALDNMNDDAEAGVYGIGMWGCWGGTTPNERFAMLDRRAA